MVVQISFKCMYKHLQEQVMVENLVDKLNFYYLIKYYESIWVYLSQYLYLRTGTLLIGGAEDRFCADLIWPHVFGISPILWRTALNGEKTVKILCEWKIQGIKSKRRINIELLHRNLAMLRITFYSISCFLIPPPLFFLYIYLLYFFCFIWCAG